MNSKKYQCTPEAAIKQRAAELGFDACGFAVAEAVDAEAQRRYGYYVLPVLYGERFAGRIEPVCDRRERVLRVRHFWPEENVNPSNRFLWALEDAVQALCRFHGLSRVVWEPGWLAEESKC